MKVIYCAGEQARVVIDVLRRSDMRSDLVLLDDDPSLQGTEVAGVPVVGGSDKLAEFDTSSDEFHVAFGDRQRVRLEIMQRLTEREFDLFTVVAPTAVVSETANLGDGTFVNEHDYIGPGCTLGSSVLVDNGVNVSHDADIADGVTIAPGATFAGGVSVGRDAFVGAAATVIDDVTIGEESVVGAGAVVTSDVAPGETVTGVPATPLE